jgi:diaminopimelate epimerase
VLQIETGAGLLACAVHAVDGRVDTVAVQMGRPRLMRQEIPMAGPASERAIKATLTAEKAGQIRSFTFTAVSMGNPHAVIFIPSSMAPLPRPYCKTPSITDLISWFTAAQSTWAATAICAVVRLRARWK